MRRKQHQQPMHKQKHNLTGILIWDPPPRTLSIPAHPPHPLHPLRIFGLSWVQRASILVGSLRKRQISYIL